MRIEIQIHALGGTLGKKENALTQDAITAIPVISKTRRDGFRFLA
jgi:hypothetical protein